MSRDKGEDVLAYILAQAEGLGGNAGWVGAGLLGLVLSWLLMIHLPAKDKQIKDLLTDKDEQIKLLLEHKWQAIISMSADHKENLKALGAEFGKVVAEISAHCDKELERLIRVMEKDPRPGPQ